MLCYHDNLNKVTKACEETWLTMVEANAAANNDDVYQESDMTAAEFEAYQEKVKKADKKAKRKARKRIRRIKKRLKAKGKDLSKSKKLKAVILGYRNGQLDMEAGGTKAWDVPRQCADNENKYWAVVKTGTLIDGVTTREFKDKWVDSGETA